MTSAAGLSPPSPKCRRLWALVPAPKAPAEEPKVQILSIHGGNEAADQGAGEDAGRSAGGGGDADEGGGVAETDEGRPEVGDSADEGGASTMLQTMAVETTVRPNTAAPEARPNTAAPEAGEARPRLRAAGTHDYQRPKTAPGHTGYSGRKPFDLDNDGKRARVWIQACKRERVST